MGLNNAPEFANTDDKSKRMEYKKSSEQLRAFIKFLKKRNKTLMRKLNIFIINPAV